MRKEYFSSPAGVHPPGGAYSHAVRVGNTIYVAGQVGWDRTGKVASGGFEAQAVQALENLKQVLAAAGASLRDVVKLTSFMVNMEDLPTYGQVRKRYFSEPYPASTTVRVAGLGRPELLIEVEAVAVAEG